MRAASVITGAAAPGSIQAVNSPRSRAQHVAVELERRRLAQRRAHRLESGPRARALRRPHRGLEARPGEQPHGVGRHRVHQPRSHDGAGRAQPPQVHAQAARVGAQGGPDALQRRAVQQPGDHAGHAALGAHVSAQPTRRDVGLGGLPRPFERGLEARLVGERGLVAARDVDGAPHRRLGAGDEEAAGEGGGVRAEASQQRVAVAHRRARSGHPLEQRLGARARAHLGEHERGEAAAADVHERDRRLVAQPRAHVAPRVEGAGRGRDGAERGVAQREVAGDPRREPLQAPRGGVLRIGREAHERERVRGDEPRRLAAGTRAAQRARDRDREDPRQQRHRPGQHEGRPAPASGHSPRRRCLRSTKSITSGIPSSA